MQRTILDWLEKTAAECPEKTAFSDTEQDITFGSIKKLACCAGSQLLREGVEPGEPVVVLTGRHVYTPVCFTAVVYSGAFYAPIDPTMPVHRQNQMLGVANARFMITDREHLPVAESLDFTGKLLLMEELYEASADEALLADRRRWMTEDMPLYLIFTSGSTGVPKGVLTSHHSLMCYIEAVREVLDIRAEDVFGGQSPLDYIAAVRDIYLPYATGAGTVILPKQLFSVPVKLFEQLNVHKVTTLCWSVAGMTLPVKLGAFKCVVPETVKKVCFSGSVMPGSSLKVWQEHMPETLFVNQYGPTEATASSTYYIVKEQVTEDTALPIGIPYKNYRVLLLDAQNQQVKPGETGEICIAGPILALGYYRDKKRTDEVFVTNPTNNRYQERIYKTGDLGSFRQDGVLLYHGRLDRQVKLMGHRVELGEVEKAAQTVAGVDECCVLFYKEKEQLYLFYTGAAERKDIVLTLREQLPAFMVPRKIVTLEEMPRLANGKTDMMTLKTYMK